MCGNLFSQKGVHVMLRVVLLASVMVLIQMFVGALA